MVELEIRCALRILPKTIVIDAAEQQLCMMLLKRRMDIPHGTKILELDESFVRREVFEEAHVYAKEFGIECGCNDVEYVFV